MSLRREWATASSVEAQRVFTDDEIADDVEAGDAILDLGDWVPTKGDLVWVRAGSYFWVPGVVRGEAREFEPGVFGELARLYIDVAFDRGGGHFTPPYGQPLRRLRPRWRDDWNER